MKPIITTAGKLAQLRYELPHRAHDAHVYPVKAPNGSTVLLYAHETGVGIVWRGGRPLKYSKPTPLLPNGVAKAPAKVNGNAHDVVMIIDSDDDEPPAQAPPLPVAEFEDEEEELDPDQPYPSIIQDIYLPLNGEVLHIAVPNVPAVSALRAAESVPAIFRNKMVFAVTCADYSVLVITLPLNPPSDAAKETTTSGQPQYGEEVLRIPSHAGHQSIPRGISMTWTSRDGSTTGSHGWDLLVASHSAEVGGLLKIWRLNLSETSVTAKAPIVAYRTLTLRHPATKVVWNSAQHPKPRHSQLLITDGSGTARVYDPLVVPSRKRRGGTDPEPGAYVALFQTTFEQSQVTVHTPAILARRKHIIDAVWATDGNSILALMADGEWGIWDVSRTGPSPPADPSAFSVRGFVGTSEEDQHSSSAPSPRTKSSRSSLAPMTPNTRRTKEVKLFQGTSSGPSVPKHGGISIASLPSTTGGLPEDSAVIWYGSDAYRIPNLAQLWSRTASGMAGTSLPRPSLSSIQGLKLLGESITSVDQFDTTVKDARMAVPRDVLISTDHRLIILTNAAQPLGRGTDATFDNEHVEEQVARRADQALLARGELDIGGMDRLMEDMEGSGSQSLLGNPRRVLFA
jgi:hypothetical protein